MASLWEGGGICVVFCVLWISDKQQMTEGESVTFGTVKCHFSKNIITHSPPPLRGAPSRREPMVAFARCRKMEFIRTVHYLHRLSVQKIRSGVATLALRRKRLGFRLRAEQSNTVNDIQFN